MAQNSKYSQHFEQQRESFPRKVDFEVPVMFSIKVCIPSRDPVSGSILQKHKELTQWHAA